MRNKTKLFDLFSFYSPRSCLKTQKSTKSAEDARFKETLNAERGTMNFVFRSAFSVPTSAFKKDPLDYRARLPRFSRGFVVFKRYPRRLRFEMRF
jgi:hypothetical protein